MPAYNSAEHIAQAIESLMSQTFGDIEIIVSDNASTDATQEIVQRFVAKDKRVRYVRQETNIGANGNYTFVANAARGEYCKWVSSSDWCAPTFLEKCLQLLDSDSRAVLAVPRTRLFEGDISNWRDYDGDFEILDDSPTERMIRLASSLRLNNAFNGLVRTASLHRTRMVEPYIGADIVLMGHLAMLGKFLLVDEPLYYRRLETASSTALQDADGKLKHHYPSSSIRTLFQNTKLNLGWLRVALAAPIPAARARSCSELRCPSNVLEPTRHHRRPQRSGELPAEPSRQLNGSTLHHHPNGHIRALSPTG